MVLKPAAERWIEIANRRAYCCLQPPEPRPAETPPLLLLHGISCCTETWRPFMEAVKVAPGRPALVVPDLPAHGRSEAPPVLLDMPGYARWVVALLDSLGIARADVMGHSMGCQIALALADAEPDRVGRVIVLGPTTGGRHVSSVRDFLGLLADSLAEPSRYNRLLMRVFLGLGPLRYLRTVRQMQRDDAFAHAARVRHPLLVLRGSRDRIVPEPVARALARNAPHGTFREVPGAAHAAQYSDPGATASRVLEFLRRSA